MESSERLFVPRVTRAWYVACSSRDLAARPVARTILGIPLVLFRGPGGSPVALLDRCAHRNVPLSLGRVEEGVVACAYHGWRFDGSGACVEVPGLGEAPPRGTSVDRFPAAERDGFVWVWATPGDDPDRPPFRVPAAPDRRYLEIRRDLEAGATLHATIENVLDVPHTAFLHRGLFRGSAPRQRIRVRVSRSVDGVQAEYLDEPRPAGWAGRILAPRGGVVTHVDRFALPSIAQVEYRLGDDVHLLVTVLGTPVDDFRTRLHAVALLRTPLPRALVRLVALPVVGRVLAQDVAMLETQTAAVRRFGGEDYRSTRIDVLGAQIARLLRRAASGAPPDDGGAEDWVREFTMEA